MHVLVVLPPAEISREVDLLRAMPDTRLTIVSDRSGWGADDEVVLPVRRLPVLGAERGSVAALAWYRGLGAPDIAADVVVSLELCSPGSRQATRLARRLRVPHGVVMFENLSDNLVYRLPPWRQMAAATARTADGFVGFTHMAGRHAVDRGASAARVAVVHPGVDLDLWSPRSGGRAPSNTVVFVGRLQRDMGADKGVEHIVDACDRLAGAVPDLKLVLIGDGPLRADLERRATAGSFLEVAGPLPHAEVARRMREEGRVFTIASNRTKKWAEQFGFALVEAMATGLPVVSTTSGAIPEVVPPWNPLVPERDVDGLVEGLGRALSPEGDDWGRRNRAHAEQRYDLRRQGLKLRGVLQELVDRSAPASLTE